MNEKISRTEYGEKFILNVLFNKFICFMAMLPMPSSLRAILYSLTGAKIGKNVFIASYVLLDDQYPELVTIEDNTVISYRASIIMHDYSKNVVSSVTIKQGAFIGACATILPGVIVGEGAVIGAGTTIVRDVSQKTTIVGARERMVKTIGE